MPGFWNSYHSYGALGSAIIRCCRLVLGRTTGNSKFSGIREFERNSLAINRLKDENEAKNGDSQSEGKRVTNLEKKVKRWLDWI